MVSCVNAVCWKCNKTVQFLSGGWICNICGQHGGQKGSAATWEEGRRRNVPYWLVLGASSGTTNG